MRLYLNITAVILKDPVDLIRLFILLPSKDSSVSVVPSVGLIIRNGRCSVMCVSVVSSQIVVVTS